VLLYQYENQRTILVCTKTFYFIKSTKTFHILKYFYFIYNCLQLFDRSLQICIDFVVFS